MPAERLLHPKYRRDIDGLRAIAVLSVVAFHAAPGRVPGGFIGVDIFFVISGFLISTIIAQNLDKGSFSFATFYQRRIKRIFPALLVVLVACFIVGSLLLTTEEYRDLSQHIAAGAGFYSNFLLWSQSGYFDDDSSMKMLLHLWSLSIEEQFYIVWPLTLWLLCRRENNLLATVIVLTLLSFIANIYVVSSDVTAAFYSPLTRAWELLFGAILAIATTHRSGLAISALDKLKNTLGFVGGCMVLAGLVLINEHRLFPGWWAVLPVVGTTLLIAATEQAWINRVILSNRVLVWFGLISYPLYLTHWPLLSILRILESGEVSQLYRLAAVVCAIVCSWLIYTWIEKPVRTGTQFPTKALSLLTAMVIVGLGGYYVYQQQGMAGRIGTPPLAVNGGDIGHRPFFAYMSKHYYPCMPLKIRRGMGNWEEFQRCYQSHNSEINDVALVGDSHAEHLFIGVAEVLEKFNVVYYGKGGAPLLSNPNFQDIFSFLAQDRNIRVILLSAKWIQGLEGLDGPEQEKELRRTLEFLLAANKTVFLVDDTPEFAFVPSKCKYAGRLGQENTCQQDIAATSADNMRYYPLFTRLVESYPTVKVIHTQDFFCDSAHCAMSSDGVLHFRDYNHLNVDGSIALWRYLERHTTSIQDITAALAQ